MELAFGLLALASCITCAVCGCRGHRRIQNLEARLIVIEQEKQQQDQQQQMKQMIQESIATQQKYIQPSAPSMSYTPVKVV
jgi:hypothetical protein